MRVDDGCDVELARQVATRLNVPLLTPNDCPQGYVLALGDTGWRLETPPALNLGVLQLDFARGATAWRLRQAGRRQPLGRALGLQSSQSPRIVDATAGLGRDGMVLAHLGCRMTLLERSPVIAFLLCDALQRLAPDSLRGFVEVVNADANAWLRACTSPPDAVYLDPMYPERVKSALVKKEMRILREVVGPDSDATILLDAALHSGARRVVVKRPHGAPCLEGPDPTHKIDAPNTRYDVYLCAP
ncbi:class I SAM-dependent methyltransferase [Acidihalobacter ferrooxydans]|uniref:Ribosomal RNA small subunit methyltransferase J n=1 Tax=Acidihalobacter ferrooxydans TaxID=1765967 RepID=A0A1P8UFU7_9GAMM|nr:class I SAM-dependent methyltransferase [Acidihalobacter ferrooxydans]APZ42716.1 hypothetical protein BW247_06080 [Acidihalobacter ferrooxydans]